jgi:DNA mismatch endonuclease, patch repair protein
MRKSVTRCSELPSLTLRRTISVQSFGPGTGGKMRRAKNIPIKTQSMRDTHRNARRIWKTDAYRRKLMQRVRQHGTDAEVDVRTLLSSVGARYRLNVKGLPGRPDIANRSRKKAIFVHGCFWHNHQRCGRGRIPKRNASIWTNKLTANAARDKRKIADLRKLGFDVLVVWGCELGNKDKLKRRIEKFWNA